ncbi:MAG TPA: hypothetical protein VNZ64_23820 [Candidatus Acidoferrum sp.]|jgi:hypothetical protein|nr:hypothetical protein [Candidatus Acidoferrum sp.]
MRPADISWKVAPNSLEPLEAKVHVFCAPLDMSPKRFEELVQPLSDEGWRQAGRVHFKRDCERFLAGSEMLPEILGVLLDVKPPSSVVWCDKRAEP